jgi:mRNA interferase YafQ
MIFDISKTGQFKRDYKTIKKRGYDISKLEMTLQYLMNDIQLPSSHKLHPLKGKYKNYLSCHIEPDWLLIFKKEPQRKLITLIRTGTHSDLF